MDVRMPDGTIVSNVPDGITQSELLSRYSKFSSAQEAAPLTAESYKAAVAKRNAESPDRSFGDVAKDAGITALKSTIGLPESFVGLADIPTGGRVGKLLEEIGYKPRESREILDTYLSEAQQAANRKVREAEGFLPTIGAALQNPSTIATGVGESLAQMLGGAGVARGLMSAAPKLSAMGAGAIGEGLLGAGSAAEQTRGESADKLLTAKQSLAALGSGVGTAAFGAAGARLANKFGLDDIDTLLASGKSQGAAKSVGDFAKRAIGSGVSEGVFEELPQSAQEKMWSNYATDKPLMEGVAEAAGMGAVTGFAMGVGGGGAGSLMGRTGKAAQPVTAQAEKEQPVAPVVPPTPAPTTQAEPTIEPVAQAPQAPQDVNAPSQDRAAMLKELEDQLAELEPDSNKLQSTVAETQQPEPVAEKQQPAPVVEPVFDSTGWEKLPVKINAKTGEPSLSPGQDRFKKVDDDGTMHRVRTKDGVVVQSNTISPIVTLTNSVLADENQSVSGRIEVDNRTGNLVFLGEGDRGAVLKMSPRAKQRYQEGVPFNKIAEEEFSDAGGIRPDGTKTPHTTTSAIEKPAPVKTQKPTAPVAAPAVDLMTEAYKYNTPDLRLKQSDVFGTDTTTALYAEMESHGRAALKNRSLTDGYAKKKDALADAADAATVAFGTNDYSVFAPYAQTFPKMAKQLAQHLAPKAKPTAAPIAPVAPAKLEPVPEYGTPEYGKLTPEEILRRMKAQQDAATAPPAAEAPKAKETPARKVAKETPLRRAAYEKNPLMTFLATRGLYHVKGKPNSLKTEFSPDKQIMVSGHGPVFKASGKQLDELLPIAIEEGYLPPDGTEQQLYSLVQRAVSGQKVEPVYSAQGVENTAAKYEERMAQDKDAFEERAGQTDAEWHGMSEADYVDMMAREIATVSDAEFAELDQAVAELDQTPAGNMSVRAAMEALGFTEQEIQDEENRTASKADEAVATEPPQSDEASQAAPTFELEAQTTEELKAKQAEVDRLNKENERLEKEAVAKEKADAARDDFTLTGSDRPADVAASQGQQDIFEKAQGRIEKEEFNPIKDANGKPIVVYRGSLGAEKETLKPTNFFGTGMFGKGINLTSSPEDASKYASTDVGENVDLVGRAEAMADALGISYAEAKADLTKAGGTVYPLNVSINNPLVVGKEKISVPDNMLRLALAESDFKGDAEDVDRFVRQFNRAADGVAQFEVAQRNGVTPIYRQIATLQNKDGLIIEPEVAPRGKGATHYLAFDKSQVRSIFEAAPTKARPKLMIDVPSEKWLQGKVDYAIEKGRNKNGVPHMSTVTGRFDKPVEVSLRVLSKLKGQSKEQDNVRQESLKYIRENWDEVSKQPPYIEVAYNGEAWVSEGNHRIMVAMEKGLETMPVEIRYFDGGERANGPLNPSRIPSLDEGYGGAETNELSSALGNIEQLAKDYNGEIVYGNDDRGLIRAHGAKTGEPIYVPYVKDQMYQNDIDQFPAKSFGLKDSEYRELVEAKAELERKVAEQHAKKPFLIIPEGVSGSKGVPGNVLSVSKSWAKLLKLDGNIHIMTAEEALANKDKFTGPHRALGYMGFLNEPGIVKKVGPNDYVIIVRKSTSTGKTLEVIAHEMGHIHQQQVYENADVPTKNALIKQFNAWFAQSRKGTAKELIESMRAKRMGRATRGDLSIPAKNMNSQEYWFSFSEWYADQVSRWATTSEKPVSIVEKFFAKLGAALKKFFTQAKAAKFLPNETFAQYLDTVTNSVDFTPQADMSANDQLPLFSKGSVDGVPPNNYQNYKGGDLPPAQWDSPADSKMDSFQYKLVDKQIDTKRVIERIKDAVGEISEKFNAYIKEELYHGRTAKATKDFLQKELLPLVKDMKDANVTIDEFDEYLHNRHAPEYNEHINKVNPNKAALKDRGSGISNDQAAAYMKGLSKEQKATFEKLATQLDSIVNNTQEILIAGGIETKETIDAWRKQFPFYVPLKRDNLDYVNQGTGIGAGYATKGGTSKRATGSLKNVIDIFENIALQREQAIMKSEKARVGRALYGLAIQNPNAKFWLPINPDAIKNKDKLTEELEDLGLSAADAANIAKEPASATFNKKTGLVEYQVNPLLRNSDNVFPIRINGKDRFIIFNGSDPRAQRMVQSLKNLDAEQMGLALGTIGEVTRFMASVNTQYNPVFGAWNFVRDVQGAALNLTTTDIAGSEGKVLKGVWPALASIYSDLRAQRSGKAPKGEWQELFERFQKAGGTTGYKDQFSRGNDKAGIVARELQKLDRGNVRQAADAVFNWLSDYNDAMENAVRLSAFKVALDKGLSEDKAASLAKNLTVNFNRKGASSPTLQSLYAFFNASVQGTKRLAETLQGPAGKKIIAGGFAIGVAQAIALAMAGYDDDEPPQFLKDKNLIIPIFGGDYLIIPMPMGFNIFPGIGRLTTEYILGQAGMITGAKSFGDKALDVTSLVLDSFNPLGSGSLLQIVSPTAFDPLAAIQSNKDAFGRPISKEDRATSPTPGFQRSREGASWFSKNLAELLNYVSSPTGTKYTKGAISPTADQIDYLIGQYTGGVGRELMKTGEYAKATVKGETEDLPSYRVPIVGKLYGETTTPAAISTKFYLNVTELAKHENELKQRQKNKDDTREYRAEHPEVRFINRANYIENQITALNKQKKALQEKDAPEAQIKKIDDQKTVLMKGLNDQIRKLQQ
jgi:hypothetical protein